MANKTILNALSSAAGAGGGPALNVEDVFSTYLYTGNGSTSSDTQTITNGIDLSGEGGLIWTKYRSGGSISTSNHAFIDTERGGNKELSSDLTGAEQTTGATQYFSFNNNGYTINSYYLSNAYTNLNNADFVSWSFRKAPKFFDVVTYTGDDTAGRTISHNLGVKPGCVIVKCTTSAFDWAVWHQGMQDNDPNGALNLNSTTASTAYNGEYWSSTGSGNNTEPTDAVFTVSAAADVNRSGETYVAYLFAHNDGDGEFGPNGDADIIKCGSYTTDGSGDASVDLGFEAQWILTKRTDSGSGWFLFDTMRGAGVGLGAQLLANTSAAETAVAGPYGAYATSTGFDVEWSTYYPNANFIYIAIRRGPMGIPESASEVFDVNLKTGSEISSGLFVANSMLYTDMALSDARFDSNGPWISDRLRSKKYNFIPNTAAEYTDTAGTNIEYDHQYGMKPWFTASVDSVFWAWKRAPSFFDVVAYSGDSVAGRTVSHNLGVAPEMIWVKNRNNTNDWNVWHSALTATQSLRLNLTNSVENNSWFTSLPTDQAFFPNNYQGINQSGYNYIAYLFASLDGISKVGSYVGDGTNDGSRIIDCGFSSGARFILIKNVSIANWVVFDTERGIVAGADPRLNLNNTNAEDTVYDLVDPHSSGFIVNTGGTSLTNTSGQTYIFYAIA